ncbi:hypothetical protein ABEV34_28495 [Methylorubrum rhodesianum]|uniref:hypothetical protein n=1 Tax=Methylorubrum rhodesianum TaxID=29427 RepID=UPI00129CFE9B|nr:hypothetical protein [Methylorubrum rhodesianum]MBB5762437.1 hypothetical protein [Methylorubrum rhodesianum]MRI57352.1 hypothetical protein [Methylobacterium sp. DB1607]
MMTADQALEQIRPDLASIIAVKERTLGSRMRAYESLGSKLGRSPTWIRKVLGRAPDVTVGLHDALNIRAAYERLCKHIADGTDAIEAENQNLRRELDATLHGDRPASARLGGAPSAAEAPALSQRVATAPSPALAPSPAPRLRKAAAGDLTELPLFGAMEPRP